MDAVEFFKTANRLCKNRSCRECPVCKDGVCMVMHTLRRGDNLVKSIEETISKVEQWEKGNPIKTRNTRQSEFLKMFPNAPMSYIIDHQEEKKGLYLSLENCEGGAVVVACNNSTGFAYIEEFDSVKAAIKWLRREK